MLIMIESVLGYSRFNNNNNNNKPIKMVDTLKPDLTR
jgi:hypothetical protein